MYRIVSKTTAKCILENETLAAHTKWTQRCKKYAKDIKVSYRYSKHTRCICWTWATKWNDRQWTCLTACLPSMPLTVDPLPLYSISSLFLLPTPHPLHPLPLRHCCSLLRCSVAGTKVQLHKLNRASRASTFCQSTPFPLPCLPRPPSHHHIHAFNDNSQVGMPVGGRWLRGGASLACQWTH